MSSIGKENAFGAICGVPDPVSGIRHLSSGIELEVCGVGFYFCQQSGGHCSARVFERLEDLR